MRLVLAALALAACACSNPTVSPELERTSPVAIAPAGPVNATPQAPLTASARAEMLPSGTSRLSDVSAVHLVLSLSGLTGATPVEVELTAPDGRVYQRLSTTLVDNGQSAREVAFDVPVAGTGIENAMMSGQWTARFVTGATTLTTQTFVLDP